MNETKSNGERNWSMAMAVRILAHSFNILETAVSGETAPKITSDMAFRASTF